MLQIGVGSMQVSTKGRLRLKVIFHQRSSSTEVCLPPRVVFHQRLSSPEGHLPPKVVFHCRLSSTEAHIPLTVVSRQRLPSTEGCLPLKGVFHQRSSCTEGVFHRRCNVIAYAACNEVSPACFVLSLIWSGTSCACLFCSAWFKLKLKLRTKGEH